MFSTLSLLPCVQMSIQEPLVPGYSDQPQGESYLQLLLFLKQHSCSYCTCGFLSVCFGSVYKLIWVFLFPCIILIVSLEDHQSI